MTPQNHTSEGPGGVAQVERWREPFTHGWGTSSDAARTRLSALLAELGARLATMSPDAILDSAQSGEGEALAATTRFQRDPSTNVTLRDGHERVRVDVALELGRGASTTLQLPDALRPMLEWLATNRAPVTLADVCARFPDWDESAVRAVVAAFVRTKAVVLLPFEAFS